MGRRISRSIIANTSARRSVQNIALVDAGVIFALLNRRDSFHGAVSDLFIQGEQLGVTLLTTWPVIAEVCSMLPERVQSAALDWVESTQTDIVNIDAGLDFMRNVMIRYADLPCDFADASLLYAAQVTKVREVWTFDRDFYVYRLPDRSRFSVVPGGGGSPKTR